LSRRLRDALERADVATITKPILLAALALATFVLLYPAVRDRLPRTMNYPGNKTHAVAQSASQLSSEEFAQVDAGFTPDRLRGFAGEPSTTTEASVEGVRLECWYYGVAGDRGAYQICFENGRLSGKARFGRG
jgi:hypothetical protein